MVFASAADLQCAAAWAYVFETGEKNRGKKDLQDQQIGLPRAMRRATCCRLRVTTNPHQTLGNLGGTGEIRVIAHRTRSALGFARQSWPAEVKWGREGSAP